MKDERMKGKSNGGMKNERKINWKMNGRKRVAKRKKRMNKR